VRAFDHAWLFCAIATALGIPAALAIGRIEQPETSLEPAPVAPAEPVTAPA
jgi:hypothetical protein